MRPGLNQRWTLNAGRIVSFELNWNQGQYVSGANDKIENYRQKI